MVLDALASQNPCYEVCQHIKNLGGRVQTKWSCPVNVSGASPFNTKQVEVGRVHRDDEVGILDILHDQLCPHAQSSDDVDCIINFGIVQGAEVCGDYIIDATP